MPANHDSFLSFGKRQPHLIAALPCRFLKSKRGKKRSVNPPHQGERAQSQQHAVYKKHCDRHQALTLFRPASKEKTREEQSRAMHKNVNYHFPFPFLYQSSSSSFLAMAFFLANSASARLGPKLGVGVLLLLESEPFWRLIPLSRGCKAAGLRPGLAGGVGAAGLERPLGGGGGARGAATGAGAACSST